MRNCRVKFKKDALQGVCWFGAFVLLFQVVFWLLTNVWVQDFWDSQYAVKAEYLESRIAENPGRPLWLMMGSSLTEDGVCPSLLNSSDRPMVFNFGLGGADLFRQMIGLRRLLEAGVKPKRVGIEVLGALMNLRASGFASKEEFVVRARRDELNLYSKYSAEPDGVRLTWLESRFNPAYIFGAHLPPHSFSWSSFPRFWRGEKRPYDKWGWIPLDQADVPYEEKFSKESKIYKDQYFSEKFVVSDFTDRALRQILGMCKAVGIDVFLVRMPESPRFQQIYTPEANQAVETYLSRFTSETGLPFIDARSWIDEKGFDDGHHLNPDGAKEFTKRMGNEFLRWQNSGQGH